MTFATVNASGSLKYIQQAFTRTWNFTVVIAAIRDVLKFTLSDKIHKCDDGEEN